MKSEVNSLKLDATRSHTVLREDNTFHPELPQLPCKERNTTGYKNHDNCVIQMNQLVKGNIAFPGTQTWRKKNYYRGSNNNDDKNKSSLNCTLKND